MMLMRFSMSFLFVAAAASSQDPMAPPGGFAVTSTSTTMTYSDGHVTPVDIYVPSAAPGPSGWPVVCAFHGSGGGNSNPEIVQLANHLCGAGFVVYAYNTRGAGSGVTQERVLLDAAESLLLVTNNLPVGTIDGTRFLLTGFSGGGTSCVAGAAYSGKPLPLVGFVSDYPEVRGIVTEIAASDATEVASPNGTLAADYLVVGKPMTDPVVAALAADDYATVRSLVDTTFNQGVRAELATSTVPILAMFAMQDFKIVNQPGIDLLSTVPQGPVRFFLSTGGHSTVKTTMERAMIMDMRRRWFDRYAKGIANGADQEAFVEVAMQPPTTTEHLAIASIWEHRQLAAWPPANTVQMHLHGGGSLQTSPPLAGNLTHVVDHVVPSSYDLGTYIHPPVPGIGAGQQPAAVLSQIALDEETFTSAPLGQTFELAGRPVVELTVSDSTGNFQLTAVLRHIDPAGGEHWITAGTTGVRTGVAGQSTIAIELGDVGQILPAGHRLELTIENVCDFHAPNSRRIRFVPYFTDTATRIDIGPAMVNALQLPLEPYRAELSPRLGRVSVGAGFQHDMQLRAGLPRAGLGYALLVGCSGEAPGTNLLGSHVPLNLDGCSYLMVGALNAPFFPMSAGVLDPDGTAAPSLLVPPTLAPIVSGWRLTFAGVVLDATGQIEVVGGPAVLQVDP